MKKIIAIDIDDTLTNLYEMVMSYGFKFAKDNKIEIPKLDLDGYEASDIFYFDEPQHSKFMKTHLKSILTEVKSRPLAREVIEAISQKYYIYILTSRDSDLIPNCKEETINWLKRENIYYDKIIFGCKEKGVFCKKNNVDILVDDNPQQCRNALINNINTYMFDNPYNKGFAENDVKRIYSWGHLFSEIEK